MREWFDELAVHSISPDVGMSSLIDTRVSIYVVSVSICVVDTKTEGAPEHSYYRQSIRKWSRIITDL